ncbi:hypothetical protein ACMGD3_23935 [Lysinibacillus sphaericus]|uniref:hypothetical protein n=1 Tax=Lysinibacillus sphaericus TaxID=1421 RepID=UPI003F78B8B5
MLSNLFTKREEIIPTITILSKKTKVKMGDSQKNCLISVRIGNEEFFYFAKVNVHYKIVDFPLYAIEYLKNTGVEFLTKLENQLKVNEDTIIKINKQYFNIKDLSVKIE